MKKLVINCAACDMRGLNEETLKAYESVKVNASCVIVNSRVRELMGRFPININAADVLSLPDGENVRIQMQNGSCRIDGTSGESGDGNVILFVNGRLVISNNGIPAAQSYYMIKTNGRVLMPKNASRVLTNLQVNGKTVVYPDGARLLNGTTVIDRMFVLRAKSGIYFSEGDLVFVDGSVDTAALGNKGVSFEAKRAIVAESLCERVVPLLSDETDIEVVADGTAYIDDDVKLSPTVVRRYGTKLFIGGDLEIPEEAEEALAQLEKLYVDGDVTVSEKLEEQFMDIDAVYDELIIMDRKNVLEDMPIYVLDRAVLERYEHLRIMDCTKVELAADIPPEMILERLKIEDCAIVRCSNEQFSAVSMVCSDVVKITSDREQEHDGERQKDDNEVVINSSSYVM